MPDSGFGIQAGGRAPDVRYWPGMAALGGSQRWSMCRGAVAGASGGRQGCLRYVAGRSLARYSGTSVRCGGGSVLPTEVMSRCMVLSKKSGGFLLRRPGTQLFDVRAAGRFRGNWWSRLAAAGNFYLRAGRYRWRMRVAR